MLITLILNLTCTDEMKYLMQEEENNRNKRKCVFDEVNEYGREEEEQEGDRTLKLFPLHPEGRASLRDYCWD